MAEANEAKEKDHSAEPAAEASCAISVVNRELHSPPITLQRDRKERILDVLSIAKGKEAMGNPNSSNPMSSKIPEDILHDPNINNWMSPKKTPGSTQKAKMATGTDNQSQTSTPGASEAAGHMERASSSLHAAANYAMSSEVQEKSDAAARERVEVDSSGVATRHAQQEQGPQEPSLQRIRPIVPPPRGPGAYPSGLIQQDYLPLNAHRQIDEVVLPNAGTNAPPAAIPEATPIMAELADDMAMELENRMAELQSKNEEIERLKRDLEQLRAAPVAEIVATTNNKTVIREVQYNNTQEDISTEFQSVMPFPTAKEESNELLVNLKTTQLQFSTLGLVGRNAEKGLLASCLRRSIEEGTRELVLISGYSGTGKTSLAATLQQEVTQMNGVFCSGKFDLYLRDEPYSGVASACNKLWEEVRGNQQCCDEIVRVLDKDMEILVEVLPQLQSIAVEQEASTDDRPQGLEAKNRTTYALQRFFRIVCSYFTGLVLSLDDLQWADLASLDLLESLCTDDEITNLVVIGCFRSNEVDDTHLLSKMMRELRTNRSIQEEGGLHITEVSIGNLGLSSVHEMLQGLLCMSKSETYALAQACHKKTHGNAFFLIKFLSHLQEQGLLEFSPYLLKWAWDITEITSKTSSTSNVVELLKGKMQDLPKDVMQLLPIMACMGSSIEESMLSIVWSSWCKQKGDDIPVEPLLAVALEEGFLERHQATSFRFAHDKIQEASMALTSIDELGSLKATVGKILLEELDEISMEATIFIVVSLLNEGLSSCQQIGNLELARLNLRAATKAVSTSAFQSASVYVLKGVELLPANKWADHYTLTLELFSLASEVQACLGRYDSMQMCFSEVVEKARDLPDTFRVHNSVMESYFVRCMNQQGFDHSLSLLEKLGHKFARRPASIMMATLAGIAGIKLTTNFSTLPQKIDDLPAMTDPTMMQTLTTLEHCQNYSYVLGHDIFALLVLKNVKLTLQHGYSVHSPPSFAMLALILVGVLNDFESASMLMSCVENKMMPKSRLTASRTGLLLGGFVSCWLEPIENCNKRLLEGYHQGLCIGDIDSAMWCICLYLTNGLMCGKRLAVLEADGAIYMKQILEFNRKEIAKCTSMEFATIANLTGNSNAWAYVEDGILAGLDLSKLNDDANMINSTKVKHNMLHAFFGRHQEGTDLSIARGDKHLKGSPGVFEHSTDYLHRSVSSFAVARTTGKTKYKKHAKHLRSFIKTWTKKGCPSTVHINHLLDAENAALKKKKKHNYPTNVKEFYIKAVDSALQGGFINHAALACERFGDFLLSDMKDTASAAIELKKAKDYYSQWGATAKVEAMQRQHSDLLV